MLAEISVLVGLISVISFSLLLSFMLVRPSQWNRFTEREYKFWVQRGIPVRCADVIQKGEQGPFLKVVVALGIVMASVLTVIPFFLSHTPHFHG